MSIDITGTRLVRLVALLASLLVLAVVFAGCSSSADSAFEGEEAPAAEPDAVEDGSGSNNSATQDRSIIITGSMYMTVENPLEAANKAAAIVTSTGGRIDAREETAPDEGYGGSATLELRIPTSRLDAVIEDLRALGTVDEFGTTASDVTNEVTDLEARISTLRASTQRIEALLVEAKDIPDILKLEDELASRQAELESLEAQQRGLTDQVSLSTITLSLTTVPVEIESDSPATFLDGLATGWSALTAFVSTTLVVLGVLLPWLALLGVIAIAVVALMRLRRSRAARADAASAEETHVDEVTTAP